MCSPSVSSRPIMLPAVKVNNLVQADAVKLQPPQPQAAQARSARVAPEPVQQGVIVAPAARVREDVKTSFSDTKAFVRKIGSILGRINTEFDISGGAKASLMDAVTDKNGKFDLSRSVRTTAEYSGKAQSGIDDLTQKGFDGVDALASRAFESIDKTFNPKETMSKAIGEFRTAINNSNSKWDKFKAGAGLALGTIKAGASAVANGVLTLGTGVTGFVAASGVAVASGAATLGTKALTLVGGAAESIGRTVVAPIGKAVIEATGKVVLGTGALTIGTLGTLKNVANVGGWMDKIGNAAKESSLGKWVTEKTSTKSDKTMESIGNSLSELGISAADVSSQAALNKSERLKAEGHEDGQLGIKDTMKKYFQTGFGKSQTAVMSVSGALTAGKFASTLAEGGLALDATKAFSALGTAGQAAVGIGAVAGPLTALGCGYKIYAGVKDYKEGTKLQEKIDQYVDKSNQRIKNLESNIKSLESENNPAHTPVIAKYKEQAAELKDLVTIAKQERSKIGLDMKKLGVAQNAILAVSGGVSTAATIATFAGAGAVVAATGPVGLGLAATGAVIAGGVATYKIYKAEKREERNEKLAAQQQLVQNKIDAVPQPSADQLTKLNEVKGQIIALRLEKDPKFAAEHIGAKLEANSSETQDFVKAVFGDDVLKCANPVREIEARMPIVSGDQRIFWQPQQA